MPRRSNATPDLPPILMIFLIVPWYVGPIAAMFAYSILRWFVPWLWPLPNAVPKTPADVIPHLVAAFAQSGPGAAPIVALMIMFVWLLAELLKFARRLHEGDIEWPSFRKNRPVIDSKTDHDFATRPHHQPQKCQTVSDGDTSRVNSSALRSKQSPSLSTQTPNAAPTVAVVQTSPIDSQIDISKLSWKEFEKLLVHVLRRFGFETEHTGRNGPDGGFDVRFTNSEGQVFLVQCKHWRNKEVDVATVREFFGVLHHEHVKGGLIVTSGLFTHPAKKFAEEKPIHLINGEKLLQVLAEIPEHRDGDKLLYRISQLESLITTEQCHRCGTRMIRKTGRRGVFLSCERYPDCGGSRDV